MDRGDDRRHGLRHLGLRHLCRSRRAAAGAAHVPGRRLHHGAALFAADRPDRAAHRRGRHGHVRQRHARRLRRAPVGTLPDRGARHRGERLVQPRSRRRRLRSFRRGRARGNLFVLRRHRAIGTDLFGRYPGDCAPDPGAQGGAAGVSARGILCDRARLDNYLKERRVPGWRRPAGRVTYGLRSVIRRNRSDPCDGSRALRFNDAVRPVSMAGLARFRGSSP